MAKQAVTTNTADDELERLYEQHAGAGVSDREEDRIQAWVKVLQQLSPELNSRETTYVEGAKAGDIWIAAKSLLIPGQTGFRFQPCDYQYSWVEWSGQPGSNSRPVNRYPDRPDHLGGQSNWGRIDLPNGHQIIETRYFMGLVYVDEVAPFPATISYSSTGAGVATNWIDKQRSKRNANGSMAPIFRYVWRMVTEEKSNDRGRWYLLVPKQAAEVQADRDQSLIGAEIFGRIKEKKLQLGDEGAQTINDQIPF